MELFRTIANMGQGSQFESFVRTVLGYYDEPHRDYHGVSHITQGVHLALGLADTQEEFDLTLTQQLAWLCHDIVYIPNSPKGSNETRSCSLMKILLGSEAFASSTFDDLRDIQESACEIIESTIDHIPTSYSCRAVIDIDLAGLADPDKFRRNSKQIQREFGITDNRQFQVGQAAFLSNLVDSRKSLYCTRYALSNWEKPARQIISDYTSCVTYALPD